MNILEFAQDRDPIILASLLWPQRSFYDKQIDIIRSVEDTPETCVVAGNQLGKDYIAGYIALSYFLRHKVVRVVSTSVKDDHLRVLWGEINSWIQSCAYPLTIDRGGPLIVTHRDIRKIQPDTNEKCPISYIWGAVSAKGEGMAGHHAPFTLGIVDEASGVENIVYTQMATWAKRIFVFGNANPTTSFFFDMVEGGDILRNVV